MNHLLSPISPYLVCRRLSRLWTVMRVTEIYAIKYLTWTDVKGDQARTVVVLFSRDKKMTNFSDKGCYFLTCDFRTFVWLRNVISFLIYFNLAAPHLSLSMLNYSIFYIQNSKVLCITRDNGIKSKIINKCWNKEIFEYRIKIKNFFFYYFLSIKYTSFLWKYLNEIFYKLFLYFLKLFLYYRIVEIIFFW